MLVNNKTELCFQAQSIYLFFEKRKLKDKVKLAKPYEELVLNLLKFLTTEPSFGPDRTLWHNST